MEKILWTPERVIAKLPHVRISVDGREVLGKVNRVTDRLGASLFFVRIEYELNGENDFVIQSPQTVADALNINGPIFG